MKKKLAFVILLVLTLVGCERTISTTAPVSSTATTENITTTQNEITNETTSQEEITSTITITETSTEETTTMLLPEIDYLKYFSIKDASTLYDIPDSLIKVYNYNMDDDTIYVRIDDFLDVISDTLQPVTVSKTDVLTISIDMPYSSLSEDDTHFEMIFNAEENTVYYNNFIFNAYINYCDTDELESDLEMIDFQYYPGNPEVTIDLDEYGIEIVLHENYYYIPLYLANLLLTGYSINVYRYQDTLYITDDFTLVEDYILDIEKPDDISQKNVVSDTLEYTYLLFDYFYGLKEYYNQDTYRDKIDYYVSNNLNIVEYFDENYQDFIIALDDLHTQILHFGYYNDDVTLHTSLFGKRTNLYIDQYIEGACYLRNKELQLKEYDDYYVLEVNVFTENTGALLDTVMKKVDDPTKEIFIDLSCNTGGLVMGVYELLSYMTDEPMTCTYSNSMTGDVWVETYQSSVSHKMENEFYVYTSYLTYSAANLFVSIVSENDLAFIVGEPTLGGACAVVYHVLPNNMILTISSNLMFLDSELSDIEAGVDVDYLLKSAYVSKATDLFDDFYLNKTGLLIEDSSTSKNLSLDLNTTLPGYGINPLGYVVEIYDLSSGQLITQYETSDPDAVFEDEFEGSYESIRIRIRAIYVFEDFDFDVIIYDQIRDRLTDEINENTYELSLDTILESNFRNLSDIDYVGFEILEKGYYEFLLDGEIEEFEIYDDFGNLIDTNSLMIFDAGYYYVKLQASQLSGDYTFEIVSLQDDSVGVSTIDLVEGLNQTTLTVDFLGDSEWLAFTLESDAVLSFAFDSVSQMSYYIGYDIDEIYREYSILLEADTLEILLPAGDYLIGFYDTMQPGDISVSIQLTYPENEISGDISLNGDNYGILLDGENEITIDALWDTDVYLFTNTEEVYLTIADQGMIDSSMVVDMEILHNFDGMTVYHLEPGTHVFAFQGNSQMQSGTVIVTVNLYQDESNETNPIEINLGDNLLVVIENYEDIDYYSLSLDERQIVILNSGELPPRIEVFDSLGERVGLTYNSEYYMDLPAGDYLILISNKQDSDYINEYSVSVSTFDGEDIDPSRYGFDLDLFRQITVDTTEDTVITGTIDYIYDRDYVILVVTEQVSLTYTRIGDISVSLGDFDTYDYISFYYGIVLEPGMYYLRITCNNMNIPIEYTITITPL